VKSATDIVLTMLQATAKQKLARISVMSADWLSNPPAMDVEGPSSFDYQIGEPGQTYFGIVNVHNGVIYLVAGGPVIKGHGSFWPREPNFGRKPILATFTGQGGHGTCAERCNIIYMNWMKDHAGFSVTKLSAGNRKLRFRSSLNRNAFHNNPDDSDDEAGRFMPPQWEEAVANALEAEFH
jgi:hypothetical protein